MSDLTRRRIPIASWGNCKKSRLRPRAPTCSRQRFLQDVNSSTQHGRRSPRGSKQFPTIRNFPCSSPLAELYVKEGHVDDAWKALMIFNRQNASNRDLLERVLEFALNHRKFEERKKLEQFMSKIAGVAQAIGSLISSGDSYRSPLVPQDSGWPRPRKHSERSANSVPIGRVVNYYWRNYSNVAKTTQSH